MATKKKNSTKTSKSVKKVAAKTHKKCTSRTNCKKGSCDISSRDRAHVCFVAALAIVAGILLCADAAIMMVA